MTSDKDQESGDPSIGLKGPHSTPTERVGLVTNISRERFFQYFVPLAALLSTIIFALVESLQARLIFVLVGVVAAYIFAVLSTWKERLIFVLGVLILTPVLAWIFSHGERLYSEPRFRAHDIMPTGYIEVEIVAPCSQLSLITISTKRSRDQDPQRGWDAGQVRLQLRSGSTVLAEEVNQPHSFLGSTVKLRVPASLVVGGRYQIRAINESPNSIPFLLTGSKEVEILKYVSFPRTFVTRERESGSDDKVLKDYFYDGVPDMNIESACSG
jgi:hypothetical protein